MHKAFFWPLLTNAYKEKCLQWAQQCMNINFQTVLFIYKCNATLDVPDVWRSGWLMNSHCVPTRLHRQQGGGRMMFWAGMLGIEMVRPFRVPEGFKMTSAKYVEFLTDHFLP